MRLLSTAYRAALVLVSAGLLAVASPGVSHAAGTEVYDGDFPDPYVLPVTGIDSTTYWAYATGSAGLNLQVMKSTDLRTWSKPADPLPRLPRWARPGYTWAPSVLAVGGRHVLYYTARHAASERQCIGRAVSSKGPLGPFSDSSSSPLICQLEFGGSIDPDAFRDRDGRLYLHWKSDDNAIGGVSKLFGAELSSDGLRLGTDPDPKLLLKYDQQWEDPLIEAPQMVYVDPNYHLFYSGNWWESENAAVGYGKCDGPLSDSCTKTTTDTPEGPGPWLTKDAERVGPAGQTFFQKPIGERFVAYHAWDDAVGYRNGGRRSLWIQSVDFSSGSPALGS